MRIAFIVHRTSFYKIFGPIIEAALALGWTVECWLLQEGASTKKYLIPTENNLPNFQGKVNVRIFGINDELGTEIRNKNIDVIMALYPKSHYVENDGSGPFFVTLQSGIDIFVNSSLEQLASSDLLALYSPYWTEWGARYYQLKAEASYEESFALLDRKSVYPGAPQLDQFAEINPMEIRNRLGIPSGRSVVLLLPMTLGNKGGTWPRFFEANNRGEQIRRLIKGGKTQGNAFISKYWTWPLREWNDRTLTESIRKFARKNDSLLLVKGREKDPIRPWTAKLADYAVYDETYYPATIYELLAIADVCIHFYSTAVLEAAYVNVFGITIDRPSPSVEFSEESPVHHRIWRRSDTGSAFNFPGVNKWMTIPQAMSGLPNLELGDLSIQADSREQFIQKYIGFGDTRASSRVLDAVVSKTELN